jgi:hypothetical protein
VAETKAMLNQRFGDLLEAALRREVGAKVGLSRDGAESTTSSRTSRTIIR